MVQPDYCQGCAHDKIEFDEQQLQSAARIAKADKDLKNCTASTSDPSVHASTKVDYFYNPFNVRNPARYERPAAGQPVSSNGPGWTDSEGQDDSWLNVDAYTNSRLAPPWPDESRSKQYDQTSSDVFHHSTPSASYFTTASPKWARSSTVEPISSGSTSETTSTASLFATAPLDPTDVKAPQRATWPSYPDPLPRWTPDVMVCGFHMHALEWHKMQKLTPQDTITLVQRAQCPVFNLSVTRWLGNGQNHLQKEPFNKIECRCGAPMVVSSGIVSDSSVQPGHYGLVCSTTVPYLRNVDGNDSSEEEGTTRIGKSFAQESGSDKGSGPSCDHEFCLKAILMTEVAYRPRATPVHMKIPNDEWLERWLAPRPSLLSYYKKNYAADLIPILKRKRARRLVDYSKPAQKPGFTIPKRLTFKQPIDEIIETSSIQTHSHRWPVPDWVSNGVSDPILKSDNIDLWSDNFVQRMDKMNVFEPSVELIEFSIKEAIRDAQEYAQRDHDRWQKRADEMNPRFRPAEKELQAQKKVHAELVKHIEEMNNNGQEMTQLRCRICYEGMSTHAVLPCFHLMTCGECASQVKECI
ncbi:hypothetical protein BGZ58_010909, partial [Dissophora ornata]